MTPRVTLLELVAAVAEEARSEAELLAGVVYLVNSGGVQLIGTFRGAYLELETVAAAA